MLTQSINNALTRAVAVFGSSALLLFTLGLAGARAQAPETTERFKEQLPNGELLAQRVVPPLRTRLPARASLGQIEPDSVSVTLINTSPDPITYQSTTIPTDNLELMPGEQQTFDDINAPFTLFFYQKNGNLVSAEIANVNRREDSFEVELSGAAQLGEDKRSVVLLESGNIYLY
jgi:hypothetical protein